MGKWFAVLIVVVLRRSLPPQHLTDETKSLVSVSTAVVATVSALVLGLLISNANSSFSTLGGQVTALSAQILRLDQMLRLYGPDTNPGREELRESKTIDLFPDYPAKVHLDNPLTYELLQHLEDSMLALKPANPRDQWWLGQALTLAAKIGDTRWLLAQQVGQGTPKEFLALLVFWLTLLFAGFGLFAPPNLISAVTLTLCALAVAGAIGNDPRIGEGVWRTDPRFATADAPRRQGIGSPIGGDLQRHNPLGAKLTLASLAQGGRTGCSVKGSARCESCC